MSRTRALFGGKDQYYTSPETVKLCLSKFRPFLKRNSLIIEPSAGEGAFIEPFLTGSRSVLAFDIDPKHPGIIRANFLTENLTPYVAHYNHVAGLGNPPFGFQATLAVEFFNHLAAVSDVVGFIVPKSFKKASIQNKLNEMFFLKSETNLPENAFLVNGKPYNVPCVFQIWKRSTRKRKKIRGFRTDNSYIAFVPKEEAQFALRRVGGRAGQVLEGLDYNPVSTYFCKEKKKGVLFALKNIDFTEVVNSTAGVRSLSKGEILIALEKHYKA